MEGLNLKSECIMVSAPGVKLRFTNKRRKVVLNEKTINCLRICWRIFRLLIQVCGRLPHRCEVGAMLTIKVQNSGSCATLAVRGGLTGFDPQHWAALFFSLFFSIPVSLLMGSILLQTVVNAWQLKPVLKVM